MHNEVNFILEPFPNASDHRYRFPSDCMLRRCGEVTSSNSALASKQEGLVAGRFVAQSDMVALSHLLESAGTKLRVDPAQAGDLLSRANTMIASILCPNEGRPALKSRDGGMAPWQVRRVGAEIEEHLHEKLWIKQLASSVRLSHSYFSRAFKVSFGCSPHAYILHCRVERAKTSLQDTTQPLAQVALDCGFADQAHLSRTFRRHVGCTPSAWRRDTLL